MNDFHRHHRHKRAPLSSLHCARIALAVLVAVVLTGGLLISQSEKPIVAHAMAAVLSNETPAPPAPLAQITPTPQARAGRANVPAGTTARQRRIFRTMWSIVNDRYLYPDFNGANWKVVRADVNKRIAAGMSDAQFYEAMRDLIVSLNDNHSDFLSPDEAKAEDKEYEGVGTYTGVGIVSDINKEARYIYVLTVLPDSPAEQAGIRPHDHILQINGEPTVDEGGESRSHLLRGEPGTTVDVQVRTPGQEPRAVQLKRGEVSSVERIEHRLLPNASNKRIGYVLVPSLFEENVLARSRDAVRSLMASGDLDGFVLDLRTNGGGTYGNLRGLLGLFTNGEMGDLIARDGVKAPVRVRAEGIGNSQRVPLLVLISPSTESYAEVLAGALQATGRVKLIGQNSAGNIETLLSHEFEGGSRMWLAEETFRLPNGSGWEGVGLTPDIRVEAKWDEYTAENDPVLAEAIALLSK